MTHDNKDTKKKSKLSTAHKIRHNTELGFKWATITVVYVMLVAILYGTSYYYFPEPISIGFGLYLDISTAVLYTALAIWSVATIVVIKNSKLKKYTNY